MAFAASRMGVPIIQLSTDYVFEGSSNRSYREDDPTALLGIGGPKLLGSKR